jgi:uncharacterized membrane protein YeaQ/YmgE (transglycosylase-associated protein family)
MIGMTFGAFLTLLLISAIWSAIIHGAGYRALSGAEGYFAKLVVGWIGGWIASPILGYWGGPIAGSNAYIIPVIIGSLAAIFVEVAAMRTLLKTRTVATMRTIPLESAETRRVA